MDARQAAYDNSVAALRRINPKAVPIAKADEPFAIARVSEQVRQTVAPAERAPSPEVMLYSRVNNMQGACAKLVAEAKRKGIPAELPPTDESDQGARLQMLNAFHDRLEKKIDYYNRTTQEQRAIDQLGIEFETSGSALMQRQRR